MLQKSTRRIIETAAKADGIDIGTIRAAIALLEGKRMDPQKSRPLLVNQSEAARLLGVSRLLGRLKQLLVINWRQKSTARSQLKLAIEDALDTGLPKAYSAELYRQKCSSLFEHFYENYTEAEASTYAA